MVQKTGLEEKGEESSISLQDVNELAASMCPLDKQDNGREQHCTTPMSNTTSSLKDKKKSVTPSIKGTVSNSDSLCPTSRSKKSGKGIPKFNDKGICIRCNGGHDQFTRESISCYLCSDRFHACCREKRGTISANAICTPSALRMVLPLITKYGSQGDRWGNFMFICDRCSKKIHALKNGVKIDDSSRKNDMKFTDSSCNTSMTSLNHTGPNKPDMDTDDCDKGNNQTSRETSSVQLLAEVNNTVKSILANFEGQLMSKVDKLLEDRSPCPTVQKDSTTSERILSETPVSMQRSSTPSSSTALSSSSTVLSEYSLMDNQTSSPIPLATNEQKMSYLQAVQLNNPRPRHSSSIDSYLSHKKSSTSSSMDMNSVSEHSPQEDHVIVLSGSDKDDDLEESQESIENALKNVPVNFLRYNTKSRKFVISFPSSIDKESGKSMVATTTEVSNHKILVQEAKKMLPKITVNNIPNSLLSPLHNGKPSLTPIEYRTKVKELLEARFLEKNGELLNCVSNQGQMFKIVFVKTGQESTTVGIKVSSSIRDLLIKQKRIYIGNTSCKVSDHFDVRQCFRCQQVGHISSHCREKDPVCMYCSASHQTGHCPDKHNTHSHRCVNCSHSGNPALQNSCHTHHSGSDSCPIIVAEKQNIRKRTEYSKNV